MLSPENIAPYLERNIDQIQAFRRPQRVVYGASTAYVVGSTAALLPEER
jgi:hypothetical protein